MKNVWGGGEQYTGQYVWGCVVISCTVGSMIVFVGFPGNMTLNENLFRGIICSIEIRDYMSLIYHKIYSTITEDDSES